MSRRRNQAEQEEFLREFSRRLSDQGKLIEAGWASLRAVWLSADAPPDQVKDLRWAFMAGAQHTFASITTILEPGEEPTEKDSQRIMLIATELEAFAREVEASLPTEGKA